LPEQTPTCWKKTKNNTGGNKIHNVQNLIKCCYLCEDARKLNLQLGEKNLSVQMTTNDKFEEINRCQSL
jgi:hypothetical protein